MRPQLALWNIHLYLVFTYHVYASYFTSECDVVYRVFLAIFLLQAPILAPEP